jgi:hypothetical protein
MEHVTIINLPNKYKKLIPDEGYMLKRGEQLYSEAVVKSLRGWSITKID